MILLSDFQRLVREYSINSKRYFTDIEQASIICRPIYSRDTLYAESSDIIAGAF